MRIYLAVRHAARADRFYGGLWEKSFVRALTQLGHEVILCLVDLEPASRFMQVSGDFTAEEQALRGRITEQIIEDVLATDKQEKLDLFLCYFYNAHFDPAGFDRLHARGITTVNFFCNSMYQMHLVTGIAEKVMFSWHSEQGADLFYRQAGARPVWVQMGGDPELYYPEPGLAKKTAACFVGQRYADRDRWLATLVRAGVPVEIYGHGWQAGRSAGAGEAEAHQEYYLGRRALRPGSWKAYWNMYLNHSAAMGPGKAGWRLARQIGFRMESRKLLQLLQPACRGFADDIRKTMAGHEVVLNFSNVWADGFSGSRLIPHVRLRDFEGPLCGACYLTGYTEELESCYKAGEEIDFYRTEEELVDKTRFYLKNPTAAAELAAKGRARALRDHTWKSRFELLLQKTGGKA